MDYKQTETETLLQRKAELLETVNTRGADLKDDEIAAIETETREITAELEERKAEAAREAEERAKAAKEQEARKLGNNKTNEQEKRKMFELNSKEYRNAWLHELQGRPLTEEERAGYTQTSTYATNAIPTLVSDVMFAKLKKTAPMLDEITLMQVAGNLKFVAEGTRNAATAHTENNALTPAADTTVSVTLGAIEFAKLIGISKSAMLMSEDAFLDWITENLAVDIARAIDNYILNDATNGVSAITWTANTNALYQSTYAYADIAKLVALLPAAYDSEAKFLLNKATLYNKIACITNSAGNPIFVQNTEDGMVGRILGYPVVVDDYVETTKGTVYLGRWKDVVGNLSEGIIVERNDNSGFRNGTIDFRGYASFDSKPAKTDAIVKLATTT